jgi:hypothetical protein
MAQDRLYRGKGTKARKKKEFEKRYHGKGKKKADYIYGATVGKVKREREAKKKHK